MMKSKLSKKAKAKRAIMAKNGMSRKKMIANIFKDSRHPLYPMRRILKEEYPTIVAIPKFESKKFRDSQMERIKKLKIFKVKKVSKKSDSIDAYLVDLDYKKIERITRNQNESERT